MAYLFEKDEETNEVIPTAEVLLIPPFKEIYDKDTSKRKRQALRSFAFIEFMGSSLKSNPYHGYSDEEKLRLISKDVYQNDQYRPTKLEWAGIDKLKEIQRESSPTYAFLQAALVSLNTVRDFLEDEDILNQKTEKGYPIYKPKDITSSLKDVKSTLKDVLELIDKTDEELLETARNKANKKISPFADPNFFRVKEE